MGTGTTDILERCNKAGLRTPEFIQDEDFLTILWRPEKQATGQLTDHEADQVTAHETDHQIGLVSKPIRRLVMIIRGDTKTREEIMKIMHLTHRENFRLTYTAPAIADGYVAMLYPDNPKRKGQAYYLTLKGLELLTKIDTNNNN